jgi:hypothetical protein
MFPSMTPAGLALALAMTMPCATAAVDEARIFSAPASGLDAAKSTRFAINPELGRAWVELTMDYSLTETSETIRIAVPGLRYDAEGRSVVLATEDRTVVCASVERRGWGWLRHDRIEPTGACALSARYVDVPVDNGFTISTVRHLEIHLAPAPSGTSLQLSAAAP